VQYDLVLRILTVVDEKAVILEVIVFLLPVYSQTISGHGRIAINTPQSHPHRRVFVMVFRLVRGIHNDIATFGGVHMILLVVVPDSAVLRWANAPAFSREVISV